MNAVSMLFGHLLTGGASVFADVRTYWSPEAVERVTGWKPDGLAKDGFIHLINSGAAALDGTGRSQNAAGGRLHEAVVGDDRGRHGRLPERDEMVRGGPGLFPRRRVLGAV